MPFDDGRLPSPGTPTSWRISPAASRAARPPARGAGRQRQFTAGAHLSAPAAALIAQSRRPPPARTVEEHERVLDQLHDEPPALAGRRGAAVPRPGRPEANCPKKLDASTGCLGRRHLRAWSGQRRAADLHSRADGDRPGPGRIAAARHCWRICWKRVQVQRTGHADHRPRRARARPRAMRLEDRGLASPGNSRASSSRSIGAVGPPARRGGRLGLAVARRIAEAHGGTITAESEPGRAALRGPPAPDTASDVAPAVGDRPEAVAPTTA